MWVFSKRFQRQILLLVEQCFKMCLEIPDLFASWSKNYNTSSAEEIITTWFRHGESSAAHLVSFHKYFCASRGLQEGSEGRGRIEARREDDFLGWPGPTQRCWGFQLYTMRLGGSLLFFCVFFFFWRPKLYSAPKCEATSIHKNAWEYLILGKPVDRQLWRQKWAGPSASGSVSASLDIFCETCGQISVSAGCKWSQARTMRCTLILKHHFKQPRVDYLLEKVITLPHRARTWGVETEASQGETSPKHQAMRPEGMAAPGEV